MNRDKLDMQSNKVQKRKGFSEDRGKERDRKGFGGRDDERRRGFDKKENRNDEKRKKFSGKGMKFAAGAAKDGGDDDVVDLDKKDSDSEGEDEKKDEKQPKSIKNQIRSIKRSLQRGEGKLTEKAKKIMNKKLQKLEKVLARGLQKEKERNMARKSHRVRFFDRVKYERKIVQLEKKYEKAIVASEKDEKYIQELMHLLKKNRDGLLYVKYFPKDKKYISPIKMEKKMEMIKQDVIPEEKKDRFETKKKKMDALMKLALKNFAKDKPIDDEDEYNKNANSLQNDDFFLNEEESGSSDSSDGEEEEEENSSSEDNS